MIYTCVFTDCLMTLVVMNWTNQNNPKSNKTVESYARCSIEDKLLTGP